MPFDVDKYLAADTPKADSPARPAFDVDAFLAAPPTQPTEQAPSQPTAQPAQQFDIEAYINAPSGEEVKPNPVLTAFQKSLQPRRPAGPGASSPPVPPAGREVSSPAPAPIAPQSLTDRIRQQRRIAVAEGDTETGAKAKEQALDLIRRREIAGVSESRADIAEADVAKTRAPYTTLKGALGGVTLGISDVVFKKLEEDMGGEINAESTSEQVGAGVSRMLGGIFTGMGLANGMKNLTARFGVEGVKQLLAVRLGAAGISAAVNNITQVVNERKGGAEGVRDAAIGIGASMVGILPENLVKAGVGNWIAQVGTDFAYDLFTDAKIKGRLDNQSFKDWFIKEELPQLAMSIAFATQDLTNKNFEAERKNLVGDLMGKFRTDIVEAERLDFPIKNPGQRLPEGPLREAGEIGERAGALREAGEIGAEMAAAPKRAPSKQPLEAMGLRELKTQAAEVGLPTTGTAKGLRAKLKTVEGAKEVLRTSTDIGEKLAALLRVQQTVSRKAKQTLRKDRAEKFGKARAAAEGATGFDRWVKMVSALGGKTEQDTTEKGSDYFSDAERDAIHDKAFDAIGDDMGAQANMGRAITRMMEGDHLRPHEIDLMVKAFGSPMGDVARMAGGNSKIGRWLVEASGFMRTLKTMLDVSAMARQGAVVAPRHPILYAKSVGKMLNVMFSEKNYQEMHKTMQADEAWEESQDAGLYIAPVDKGNVKMSDREEAFASSWADKIPGARMSERAFNGMLNSLRMDIFKKWRNTFGDAATADDLKKAADFINAATGRGSFKEGGAAEKAMPFLGTVFFSPRWVASRIQTPLRALTPIRDSETGKLRFSPANTEAIKTLGAFIGTVGATLGIMNANKDDNVDAEFNSKSSDFGKVKVNNTRLDLTAGMGQYIRFITQMVTGEQKTLSTGRMKPADKEKMVWRMMRTKASPVVGSLMSALFGKTVSGEDFVPLADGDTAKAVAKFIVDSGGSEKVAKNVVKTGHVAARELMPLIIQQTIESYQVDGGLGAALAFGGELTGIGASTFEPQRGRKRARKPQSPRRQR